MIIRKANIEEKKYFYDYMKSVNRWITDWNNKKDLMCVIEDNGELVGFGREVIFTKNKISAIGNVWIREDYRGKKLGLKLVQYLIDNIKQNIVWLDCIPNLECYYNKLGFRKVDEKEIPKGFFKQRRIKKIYSYEIRKIKLNY